MIRTVFVFENGNVACCDEEGQQMPEFQGQKTPELVERICQNLHPDVEWCEMPPPTAMVAKVYAYVSQMSGVNYPDAPARVSRDLIAQRFHEHHPRLIDVMIAQLVRVGGLQVEEWAGVTFYYVRRPEAV